MRATGHTYRLKPHPSTLNRFRPFSPAMEVTSPDLLPLKALS